MLQIVFFNWAAISLQSAHTGLNMNRVPNNLVRGDPIKSPLSSRTAWDWYSFCAKITPHFCCFLANIQASNSFPFRKGQQSHPIQQEAPLKTCWLTVLVISSFAAKE